MGGVSWGVLFAASTCRARPSPSATTAAVARLPPSPLVGAPCRKQRREGGASRHLPLVSHGCDASSGAVVVAGLQCEPGACGANNRSTIHSTLRFWPLACGCCSRASNRSPKAKKPFPPEVRARRLSFLPLPPPPPCDRCPLVRPALVLWLLWLPLPPWLVSLGRFFRPFNTVAPPPATVPVEPKPMVVTPPAGAVIRVDAADGGGPNPMVVTEFFGAPPPDLVAMAALEG